MDDYKELWEKNINAMCSDFEYDDEIGNIKVRDTDRVVVGGIVSNIRQKLTKDGKTMAYCNIEDMTGTIEVVVFPKTYMNYRSLFYEDNKVFMMGNVDDRDIENAKLLCSKVIPFDDIPKDCWMIFVHWHYHNLTTKGHMPGVLPSATCYHSTCRKDHTF